MLEDKLNEIIVYNADTKEVIAIISNNDVITEPNINVIFNYSSTKRKIKKECEKMYLSEEV